MKPLIWSGAFVGVALLLGLNSAQAAEAGDLITCPNSSAVYYFAEDGNRYVFPNEQIFFTHYRNFDDVVEITCDELADTPLAGRVKYKPGTKLFKLQSIPTVYAVEPNGVIRPVASEQQAEAIYGPDWTDLIDDLSDVFFVDYQVGPELAYGELPRYLLIVDEDGNYSLHDKDSQVIDVTPLIESGSLGTLVDYTRPEVEIDEYDPDFGFSTRLLTQDLEDTTLDEAILRELRPVDVNPELEELAAQLTTYGEEFERIEISVNEADEGELPEIIQPYNDAAAGYLEITEFFLGFAEEAVEAEDIEGAQGILDFVGEGLFLAESYIPVFEEGRWELFVDFFIDEDGFLVDSVTVPTGSELTIYFTDVVGNHTFMIDELDISESVVQSESITLDIPLAPGEYIYYTDSGAEGTLTVE